MNFFDDTDPSELVMGSMITLSQRMWSKFLKKVPFTLRKSKKLKNQMATIARNLRLRLFTSRMAI